jgi:hypothetical protein
LAKPKLWKKLAKLKVLLDLAEAKLIVTLWFFYEWELRFKLDLPMQEHIVSEFKTTKPFWAGT